MSALRERAEPGRAEPGGVAGDAVLTALSSISHTLAETLELKEVFSRVAEAVREVLSFDLMGVIRMDPAGPGSVMLYSLPVVIRN